MRNDSGPPTLNTHTATTPTTSPWLNYSVGTQKCSREVVLISLVHNNVAGPNFCIELLGVESQGGTTITIGPPPVRRPPPPASPGPPRSPPRSPSPPGLPLSTAPPRLEQEQEEGLGKRKRVYKLGREQGLRYRNGDGEVIVGRQI